MELLDHYTRSLENVNSRDISSFVAGSLSVAALIGAYSLLATPEPQIIKAPARESQEGASYPSDFYPGAKDVETPYGSIRLYEFGPEDGKRLLFVHGITTPSAVYAGILPKMTEAGFRVCTFDLFGRGYSDSPDLKHDDRLYTSQILCVLQTIGWTQCSIIGYSLGGGLVSSFASFFPNTVDNLVLIAPVGLMARKSVPFSQKLALNEKVPFHLIEMLRSLIVPKAKEIADKVGGGRVDVTRVSQWQTEKHRGFPRSYLSSFRHAPIFDQWDMVERLRKTNLDIHAIWGDNDVVVNTQVVSDNLKRALPELDLTMIDNIGHDVCTGKPKEVVEQLLRILK